MNNDEIRQKLYELSDEKYKKFNTLLCPGVDNIIGVRVPVLRNFAKEIAKQDWREYLKNAKDDYSEEIMLQGMVIGLAKDADINEIFNYLKVFIPKISSWAECDICCAGLKITKKNMGIMWDFLKDYLKSDKEFQIRFGVVMLLDYYIVDEYIEKVLQILDETKHQGYYVKMAVAWAVSICFIKYPDITMKYLNNNTLDDFTYNKSLQKTIESYRVDNKTKEILRNMKRK